jgi:hypothetical protein
MSRTAIRCHLLVALLLPTLQGCSQVGIQPEPTNTSIPTPTSSPIPTATPRPTRTPDAAATQKYDGAYAQIQRLHQDGYLPSLDGRYTSLYDYELQEAKLGYYAWSPTIKPISDFVAGAHFKWATAIEQPDEAGCGFVFRLQENDDHYAVFLDSQRVIMRYSIGESGNRAGITTGTGRVEFGNPAEADFFVAVLGNSAYVYVDDNFIGSYTLKEGIPPRGGLAYAVRSGTNKDFGTKCEITDAWLWQFTGH